MNTTTTTKEEIVSPPAYEAARSNKKVKKTWRSVIWDNDTDQKSPEERKLLRKIDLTILVYACIGAFLKLLDQGNLGNAYISGMKEEINLVGNTYNTASSMFSVGYAVGLIPGTLLITKFRPSIVLPLAEIGWAVATFATAAVKNPAHLAACRFFVGFCESPFNTSLNVILGTWYTPAELGKRQSILFLMAAIGSLFSGYLQAATYNLAGVGGLSGWRWLYIIDGILTLPIAFLGFVIFPDMPSTARKWIFNDREKALAESRVRAVRIAQPKGYWEWSTIKRAWSTKYYYYFVFGYIFYGLSTQAAGTWFGVWLKSEGYSIYWRNIIPTFTNVVTIVTVLSLGFASDYFETRYAIIVLAIGYALFPQICLSVWTIPNGLKFFCYLTLGVEYITAVFFTYASEVFREDFSVRAFTMASMNALQYAMAAWVTILQFPASKAPRFTVAYELCAVFGVIAILIVTLIRYEHARDTKRGKNIFGKRVDEDQGLDVNMEERSVDKADERSESNEKRDVERKEV